MGRAVGGLGAKAASAEPGATTQGVHPRDRQYRGEDHPRDQKTIRQNLKTIRKRLTFPTHVSAYLVFRILLLIVYSRYSSYKVLAP